MFTVDFILQKSSYLYKICIKSIFVEFKEILRFNQINQELANQNQIGTSESSLG